MIWTSHTLITAQAASRAQLENNHPNDAPQFWNPKLWLTKSTVLILEPMRCCLYQKKIELTHYWQAQSILLGLWSFLVESRADVWCRNHRALCVYAKASSTETTKVILNILFHTLYAYLLYRVRYANPEKLAMRFGELSIVCFKSLASECGLILKSPKLCFSFTNVEGLHSKSWFLSLKLEQIFQT